ncbi:imidazole glycerol phosphate synthase subunit HisH [Synechococcus sp. 8F6]|uniref:imidazole glycerol phosphate synthase subunit HisH n=1 Tax=Synechococcus sp. 8F6 TaxID=2025606 RepID=UPI000B99AEF9|nr:imidazole glycerol phosphate synthase subunit HisH [Synechococcus sp. 8F6]
MSSSRRICIVDYGQGNLGSIRNMLARVRARCEVTSDADDIGRATHLILPGVGSFDRGMQAIADRGLREVLDRKALVERIPVLGICLGAQLMTQGSEEGTLAGLGWFRAETKRFAFEPPLPKLPTPNIGWRHVRAARPGTLVVGLEDECQFYFVHSYFMATDNTDFVALQSDYGHEFAAGLQWHNLFSAQFHPEKSHRFGIQFFKNFLNV